MGRNEPNETDIAYTLGKIMAYTTSETMRRLAEEKKSLSELNDFRAALKELVHKFYYSKPLTTKSETTE